MPRRYSLNYSIAQPTKGEEFIFFSKNTKIGEISNYLNII